MHSIRRQDAQRLFCDCLALDKIQAFLGWPPVVLVDAQNVLHLIANIIEDAYIENVGCSCYDCMELYLKFGQAADLLVQSQNLWDLNSSKVSFMLSKKRTSSKMWKCIYPM